MYSNEKTTMYSNEKTTNLLSFMIGGSIAMLFTFAVFGQQESYTITKPSYKPIVSDGGIKDTEKGITSEYSSGGTTIKLIESKRPRVGGENQGTEKAVERPIQPILRTGDKKVLVKGFPEDSQATQIATYAYKISNGDMDFLMTLKAENGGFNMYQQSNVYTNGKREESYGLCQLMRKRHKEVDTKEFWESWKYQVDVCYRKYVGGTRFYGYDVRLRYRDHFTIID